MESLLRWREPAVVVVAAVVVLRVAVGTAHATAAAGADEGDPNVLVLLLLLAAVTVGCHVRPVSRHARAVTVVSLAATVLALVVALVVTLGGGAPAGPRSGLELAERLLDLVVPVLVVLTLAVLLRRPAPVVDPQPGPALPGPEEAAPREIEPHPERQPTWQPDVAAGAAWTSAGEAASGRPATGWGTASGAGWDAPPAPPADVPVAPPPDGGSPPRTARDARDA